MCMSLESEGWLLFKESWSSHTQMSSVKWCTAGLLGKIEIEFQRPDPDGDGYLKIDKTTVCLLILESFACKGNKTWTESRRVCRAVRQAQKELLPSYLLKVFSSDVIDFSSTGAHTCPVMDWSRGAVQGVMNLGCTAGPSWNICFSVTSQSHKQSSLSGHSGIWVNYSSASNTAADDSITNALRHLGATGSRVRRTRGPMMTLNHLIYTTEITSRLKWKKYPCQVLLGIASMLPCRLQGATQGSASVVKWQNKVMGDFTGTSLQADTKRWIGRQDRAGRR